MFDIIKYLKLFTTLNMDFASLTDDDFAEIEEAISKRLHELEDEEKEQSS